jgi:hypothetical protein
MCASRHTNGTTSTKKQSVELDLLGIENLVDELRLAVLGDQLDQSTRSRSTVGRRGPREQQIGHGLQRSPIVEIRIRHALAVGARVQAHWTDGCDNGSSNNNNDSNSNDDDERVSVNGGIGRRGSRESYQEQWCC